MLIIEICSFRGYLTEYDLCAANPMTCTKITN